MSTYNLCFEQKYEKNIRFFFSESFQFLVVKFSIYLKRPAFVMCPTWICSQICYRLRYGDRLVFTEKYTNDKNIDLILCLTSLSVLLNNGIIR